jgi:uncharacterized membrane protein
VARRIEDDLTARAMASGLLTRSQENSRMLQVSKSITVKRSRQEVYGFWRELENLPRFMIHLKSVAKTGDRTSHWVANAPAGTTVEWDAEIVEDRSGELLSWTSVAGSDVPNRGTVRFTDAPADRGTEVRVELEYEPPIGSAGALIAKLFGEEPSQQITDDMRRFKQVMETGEVVLSDGSLEGAGQGLLKQRPSQAPEAEMAK